MPYIIQITPTFKIRPCPTLKLVFIVDRTQLIFHSGHLGTSGHTDEKHLTSPTGGQAPQWRAQVKSPCPTASVLMLLVFLSRAFTLMIYLQVTVKNNIADECSIQTRLQRTLRQSLIGPPLAVGGNKVFIRTNTHTHAHIFTKITSQLRHVKHCNTPS